MQFPSQNLSKQHPSSQGIRDTPPLPHPPSTVGLGRKSVQDDMATGLGPQMFHAKGQQGCWYNEHPEQGANTSQPLLSVHPPPQLSFSCPLSIPNRQAAGVPQQYPWCAGRMLHHGPAYPPTRAPQLKPQPGGCGAFG